MEFFSSKHHDVIKYFFIKKKIYNMMMMMMQGENFHGRKKMSERNFFFTMKINASAPSVRHWFRQSSTNVATEEW
jgi:uncharacterized membrane protein SpoIIM required for sporulation